MYQDDEQIDKKSYLGIIKLLTEDEDVISNLEFCINNPEKYYERNIEKYDERFFDNPDEDEIVLLGIVDELIESGEAWELDWNAEIDDFLYIVDEIVDLNPLEYDKTWFDENDDVGHWLRTLDENWYDSDYTAISLDIDSDSYVITVIEQSKYERLEELFERVGQRISRGIDI